MNFLDILILILVAIFIIKGLKNGLIIEIASLASLFLGILAGIYLSDSVASWLAEHWGFHENYTHAAAFVLIFITVIIVTRIIAKVIEKMLDITLLGFINKLLGAFFALLKGLFLISLVFYVIHTFDTREKLLTSATKEKSKLYKPISDIAPLTIPRIKAEYEKWQKKDSITEE